INVLFFFFSSRRRHTRSDRDWSSDVCSSDLKEIAGGPWIRASAAQSPCRGALELRKPEASASSHSSTGIREKAPDSRSSCPSPRQDALPPLRDSQAAPPRSDKPCAHPASGIRPPAGALGASPWTAFRAREYQSPR